MKIQITATGFELTPDLQKYTRHKLKQVSHKLPRKMRLATTCTVNYQQVVRAGTKYNTCELTLAFGNVTLASKETTPHMYAALDVTAVHLEQQIRRQYGRRSILRGFGMSAVY